MEVVFAHPRSSRVFAADVDPGCTGMQAIRGLIAGDEDGPFLAPPQPGRPYELVVARTKRQIAPNKSFGSAGVVEGDVIDVVQAGQGY